MLAALKALADGVAGSEGTVTITLAQATYLKSKKVELKSEETPTRSHVVSCSDLCEVVDKLASKPVKTVAPKSKTTVSKKSSAKKE